MGWSQSSYKAFKIASMYFVLGATWIIASDLEVFSSSPTASGEQMTRWQINKGLFFVGATTLVLFWLARRLLVRIELTSRALTDSEQRMRTALDNIPSTFVIYDAQLRFRFVNDIAVKLAGLAREQMLGRRDDELFPEDSTREYLALLKRASETRAAQSAECAVLLPDGATAIAIVNYVPLLDERGEIDQIIGATHNVTERKHAEDSLRSSEEQFRRLADNLPGMVYTCLNDEDFTMLYVSSGTERVIGFSPEALINGKVAFSSRIHPDDLHQVHEKVEQAVNVRRRYHLEFRFQNKNGDWCWLEEHGSGNYKDGHLESLQGFIRDVTRERHEQQHQAVLAQLGHELAAADTMEKLGEGIVAAASDLWTWDALSLYVRQSGQGRFRTVVEVDTVNGEKQYFWDLRSDAILSVGKNLSTPLLLNREAKQALDSFNRFGNESVPSASLMYAPLQINGRKVGVLSVQSYTENMFSEKDLDLLQQIANVAAPAMKRCKAEERNRGFSRLGEQLSGTTSPHDAAIIISSVADDMIGWDSCSLHLCYPEQDRVDQLIAYDEVNGERTLFGRQSELKPSGLVKRALTEGQLLILREPSDMTTADIRRFGNTERLSASLMWVPVRGPSGTSGVFSIQSYTYQAYDEDDLQLFQTLANHCSSTLERARAEQSLRIREQHYRQAISSAGAVPYQLDYLNDRYEFVGDGIETITGWSPEEFTTTIWTQMVLETVAHGATDEKDAKVIGREIRDGKRTNWKADIHIRTRLGEERWVADTSVAMTDENGRPIGCLGILQDITERKEFERQLVHTSLHDSLTGLANRALLLDHIQQALHRANRRENYHFAVLFLDLDRFKNINDSLGHLMGDSLLVTVGRRLATTVRLGDTVARFAGDEFVVLLDDISHPDDVIPVAEKILKNLAEPVLLDDREVFITASLGIAFDSPGYTEPEAILRDADNALYRAKARGKACYEVFNPQMHENALSTLEMENDLRRALQRNELRLHYQPIIDMSSGSIGGFEALLRWEHPTRGLVPPGDFISIAEETRLIIPIGYWVIAEAARQLRKWRNEFSISCETLTISVNLSVRQFAVPDLDQRIISAVSDFDLEPDCIKLEITESILMERHDTIVGILNRLKHAGFGLSLDDFGTGYSSLSYLHQFPIDTVKIDRSFISRIEQAGSEREIVRSIIQMAGNLDMAVIAEGVETENQMAILKELSCQQVQGFLLSRPLPPDEAAKLLADNFHWET